MVDMISQQKAGVVIRTLTALRPAFTALARAYQQAWGIPCLFTAPDGAVVAGETACAVANGCLPACQALRRHAIQESVRWGEPSVQLCPRGYLLWAVPVMENAEIIGGIIAMRPDAAGSLDTGEVRRAIVDLLQRATADNLTNAALLELHRRQSEREAERAEAIHELKGQNYRSIRDVYLVEEPALIAAIKRGDRAVAREIINRLLVGIYFLGGDRPLLLKSFLLELVVTMSRSAVEAGADPTDLLGANYSSFTELSRLDGEEEICRWLVAMLERAMDAIKANQHYPIGVLLGTAMAYMREHLQDDISRDEVAQIACLSPSHFSRVVKHAFGQSFTDLLSRMRVERARELLARTEKSLIQICLECGFNDQSYFTKVFNKYTGRTPGEYRKQHRSVM